MWCGCVVRVCMFGVCVTVCACGRVLIVITQYVYALYEFVFNTCGVGMCARARVWLCLWLLLCLSPCQCLCVCLCARVCEYVCVEHIV